jgi:hypothetical protein
MIQINEDENVKNLIHDGNIEEAKEYAYKMVEKSLS